MLIHLNTFAISRLRASSKSNAAIVIPVITNPIPKLYEVVPRMISIVFPDDNPAPTIIPTAAKKMGNAQLNEAKAYAIPKKTVDNPLLSPPNLTVDKGIRTKSLPVINRYKPKKTINVPTAIPTNGSTGATKLIPKDKRNPIIPKTLRKPIVTKPPNRNPFNKIPNVGKYDEPLSLWPIPMWYPTYAGNIAAPHGLKAAAAPALKAKTKGISTISTSTHNEMFQALFLWH